MDPLFPIAPIAPVAPDDPIAECAKGLVESEKEAIKQKSCYEEALDSQIYGSGQHRLEKPSERRADSVFDVNILSRLAVGKYRTSIFGQVLMKDVISLHQYTMIMSKIRPATIFDLGTCGGGSALWFAAQCRALKLPKTNTVSIDIIDMRKDSARNMFSEEPNVHFLQCDLSKGAQVLSEARANGLEMPHPWLIAEDCHVDASILLREFIALGLQTGDYIMFEDTHPEGPDGFSMSAITPGGYQTGNFCKTKLGLVKAAIANFGGDSEFAIDATVQDMYGYNGAFVLDCIYVKL